MIIRTRAKALFRRVAIPGGRLSARKAMTAALAATAVLAACSQTQSDMTAGGVYRFMGSTRNPDMETLENTVEYAVVPATRAFVNAPSALVVFERNLGGAVEQRIVLPNATAVRGDNMMHVRAQTSRSTELNSFDFDEVAARFGGMPAPFERVTAANLQTGSDGLGSYVYARENVGANTVCVLVLRRMGIGSRPLPSGTQALDVVMRNCVNGSLEQALAPMASGAMGVGGAQGTIYTLSPHAAPQG